MQRVLEAASARPLSRRQPMILAAMQMLEQRRLLAVLVVAGSDPAASDTNPGTLIAPLKTIQRALTISGGNNATSQSDTILIRGGVYREQPNVTYFNSGASSTDRTVIRAYADPATGAYEPVYILGSSIINGVWTQDGTSKRWYLEGWTARTSQVFDDWSPANDGAPLQQIGGYGETNRVITGSGVADMTAGCFFHDTATSRLYVWLADGSNPNSSQMSYAARARAIYQPGYRATPTDPYLYGQHLDLQGLRLRHNNAYDTLGQDINCGMYTANNQRLIDIDVRWMSGTGVILRGSSQMLNCTANYNGGNGVAGQGKGFLIQGGHYNYNFWRAYTTGSAAGIKVITNTPDIYGDIRGIEASYNHGIGIWYDTCYYNTVGNIVDGNYIHSNEKSGLFVEASKNFVISNNVIVGNRTSGMLFLAVENALVSNNTLVGNHGNAAIELNGGTRANSSSFGGGTTGMKDIAVRNNILANNNTVYDISLPLLSTNPLLTNNTSDYNLIFRRGGPLQFSRGGTYLGTWGATSSTLGEWQAASGQDLHSVSSDPSFVGGSGAAAYAIGSNSPAIDVATTVAPVPSDFLGTARLSGVNADLGAFEYVSGPAGLPLPTYVNPDPTVWLDEVLPAPASQTVPDSSDNSGINRFWSWTGETAASGLVALDSGNLPGEHRQYFENATARPVAAGETLFAWVYLDPTSPPGEIMIEFRDAAGSWGHRAYWGTNLINSGTDGTSTRRYQGPLPAAGQWSRLTVNPASIGLAGVSIRGMSFGLSNGRALLDRAGNAAAPTIAAAAAASKSSVTGRSVGLSVLGGGAAGEPNLVYQWALTGTPPAGVAFSQNGTNASRNTFVTFQKPGIYEFVATITHPASGLSTTSSVTVTVVQTATTLAVTPAAATVAAGATQQLAVLAADQFGAPMAVPAGLQWSVQAGSAGSISSTGTYTAPIASAGGSAVVAATLGSIVATAAITVLPTPPKIVTRQINDGNAQRSMVSSLTYVFSSPVTLSAGAFKLTRRSDGLAFTIASAPTSADGKTWRLTFSGTGVVAGSLPDGRYDLTIAPNAVRDSANQPLSAGESFQFFRFFGDVNGDAKVDMADNRFFVSALGSASGSTAYKWYFDYNGDGRVDMADNRFFVARLGTSLLV